MVYLHRWIIFFILNSLKIKSKKDVKILFVNCCLRKNANTKLLPVGLGYVMTYFKKNDYDFTLLDIDINEYSDSTGSFTLIIISAKW